jgi:hypothetical protein
VPDSNPFDMDFDGDADGVDSLRLTCLVRHALRSGEDEGDDGHDAGLMGDNRCDGYVLQDR